MGVLNPLIHPSRLAITLFKFGSSCCPLAAVKTLGLRWRVTRLLANEADQCFSKCPPEGTIRLIDCSILQGKLDKFKRHVRCLVPVLLLNTQQKLQSRLKIQVPTIE